MSTIQAANISDGTTTVGTEYVVNGSAKAWVNFTGTGTIAIRESLNASSLTDSGVGQYQVNYTSAFSGFNHAPVWDAVATVSIDFVVVLRSFNTGAASVYTSRNGGISTDTATVLLHSMGDLA